MMYERLLIKHMPREEWLFVHYDQVFDGSAVPRIEQLVGAGIDAGVVHRSLRRSAASIGVPRRTADIYKRLCALAGYRPGLAR